MSKLDKLHDKILASKKVVGDPYYLKKTPEELLEFARAEGLAFEQLDYSQGDYVWSYVPRMSVEEIAKNLVPHKSGKWTLAKWKKWLEVEQSYKEELEMADYLPVMAEKMKTSIDDLGPLVIMRLANGKYDIGDGYHRFAVALVNGIKKIPVVLGVPR